MIKSTSRDVTQPGLLDETLAGVLGVGAVRDLALGPVRHGVGDLSGLRLIRTKLKPSRKFTATYVMPDGRHVAVIWTSDPVQVLVSPHDPTMPHVERLSDPARLADLLGFAGDVETVRYRPGQRHVLRVTAPDQGAYVKVDRDESAARSVPVAEALHRRLAEACPDVDVAEPIGYVAPLRAGLWRASPGEPLSGRLVDRPSAERWVHLLGRATRALHETRLSDVPVAVSTRDADAEIAATVRAGEHIAALLPSVGTEFAARVDDVAEALSRVPTEAPTFTHGDLKSDNILVHGDRVRLLDLDRSGPADPALDLAKFTADLLWWSDDALPLIAGFKSGYGECDPSRWDRAEHLTRLFQLKLAARRCPVHDPSWESDVRARVAAAPLMAREA